MDEVITEEEALPPGDYLNQNGIGLDYNESQETFYVTKRGKILIAFRYSLIDAYADLLSEGQTGSTIIEKLLKNSHDIYGVDKMCLIQLRKVFREHREKIIQNLPPVLQELVEHERYSKKMQSFPEVVGDGPDWKEGKTKEEIKKVEAEFKELEREAMNEDNFKVEDGKTIFVGSADKTEEDGEEVEEKEESDK